MLLGIEILPEKQSLSLSLPLNWLAFYYRPHLVFVLLLMMSLTSFTLSLCHTTLHKALGHCSSQQFVSNAEINFVCVCFEEVDQLRVDTNFPPSYPPLSLLEEEAL